MEECPVSRPLCLSLFLPLSLPPTHLQAGVWRRRAPRSARRARGGALPLADAEARAGDDVITTTTTPISSRALPLALALSLAAALQRLRAPVRGRRRVGGAPRGARPRARAGWLCGPCLPISVSLSTSLNLSLPLPPLNSLALSLSQTASLSDSLCLSSEYWQTAPSIPAFGLSFAIPALVSP